MRCWSALALSILVRADCARREDGVVKEVVVGWGEARAVARRATLESGRGGGVGGCSLVMYVKSEKEDSAQAKRVLATQM